MPCCQNFTWWQMVLLLLSDTYVLTKVQQQLLVWASIYAG